jgi:amino acid adenylation domain-containing protein
MRRDDGSGESASAQSEFPVAQAARTSRQRLPADSGRCNNQLARQEILLRANTGVRDALNQLCADSACSVDDAALACFIALLYRHIQQSVISVAVSAETRIRVLACTLSDETTLNDILTKLRAAAHEPQVDRGDSPVCDAVFGPANACLAGAAPIALMLGGDSELTFRLTFDGHTFLADRMHELLQQLQLLMVQAARAPASPVLDHSLVSELARSVMPDPTTVIEKPRYPLVSESILARAGEHPDSIAVSHDDRNWTYAELAQSSGNLAARLRRDGIVAGDVVAICGPRGFAVVSAMLGVFRSGGVLVNIDPKLPLERQKVMLRQARVKYLVRVGQSDELAAEDLPMVRVDALSGEVAGADLTNLATDRLPDVEPSAPAYIFFTSGSTGTPKAVVGTHEGLAHFLDWQRGTFRIDRNDRASHITALSFDAVLRDAFLVLTTGGTLCVPSEGDILDPAAILTWMQAQRITVLHTVPSVARAWLNHVPSAVTLPSLRFAFLSGEPLTDVLLSRFRAAFGNKAIVVNLYGPTETTMVKCYHQASVIEPGIQPIGVPMPQTQVLILNRRGRICGLNETGEIVIRTPFRTLGYLNDPAATARSFVPNPFRHDPQDLVYRTGDNGRYRTDGLLQIAGRLDNQVKIRGIRVEPGEIENAICHHPTVREAAIVAFDNEETGKYLAAYVALKQTPPLTSHVVHINELRKFLRDGLPDHMVPAKFVILDALPLNANGKVDKASLPAPAETDAAPADADGPATEREQQLVAIWKTALGRSHVSVNDSFGALGGDSLSSIGALMAMRDCGVSDDLARGIFEGLTIRQIAGREAQQGVTASTFSRHFAHVQSPIFIRAVAIVSVVAGHFHLFDIVGNIKALLIVSGLSFARFQLKSIEKHGSVKPVLHFMFRLALPTLLYTIFLQSVSHSIHVESWFFIDNLIDPNSFGGSPWFIELLLQCIALTAIPLSFRRVREFAVKNVYAFGLLYLAAAYLAALIVPRFWNTAYLYNRVPQFLLWLMAFGWCAAYSDTYKKKIISSVAFVCLNALNAEWFGWFPLVSGLVVTWFGRIPVPFPRSLVSAFNAVAGASLFIYLTHFQVKSILQKLLPHAYPLLSAAVAVTGGILLWKAWNLTSGFVMVWLRDRRSVRASQSMRRLSFRGTGKR